MSSTPQAAMEAVQDRQANVSTGQFGAVQTNTWVPRPTLGTNNRGHRICNPRRPNRAPSDTHISKSGRAHGPHRQT